MLDVLADRTFRHLFAAQVVALLGTGLATIAPCLLAFDLAGDNAGLVLGRATPGLDAAHWPGCCAPGCWWVRDIPPF